MNEQLCWLSAVELAARIRRKEVSPVEAVEAVLDRIDRLNPTLCAYCTVTAEAARRAARDAEHALMTKRPELGPLHGVPFSVKDVFDTKGIRTTFG
jgi:Asp-tRNA(Asn)/Glu-tRNA(Gln) amidotransferase A subunit family amidase